MTLRNVGLLMNQRLKIGTSQKMLVKVSNVKFLTKKERVQPFSIDSRS
jgi:hypothetical protein